MIQSLQILDPKTVPLRWWKEVFPRKRSFAFHEGINVLWGPNGSGKTTVLRLIGTLLHCHQGGISIITQESLRALFEYDRGKDIVPGVQIQHDGQTVMYFDPEHTIGLYGGAFDYDFLRTGLDNCMTRESTGQGVARRLVTLLQQAMAQPTPDDRLQDRHMNDVWTTRHNIALGLLKGSIAPGPRTVLLDEPDGNLDWPARLVLWFNLQRLVDERKYQFIIATHSPFALRLQNAHWIELRKGYRKECLKVIKEAGLWSEP